MTPYSPPLSCLSRQEVTRDVIHVLNDAVKNGLPLSDQKRSLLKTIKPLQRQLNPQGQTTAGAVIKKILSTPKPRKHSGGTLRLLRLQKRINALFQEAGLNVVLSIHENKQLGDARPVYFERTAPEEKVESLRQPRLSKTEVIQGITLAQEIRPPKTKPQKKLIEVAFAVAASLNNEHCVTGSQVFSCILSAKDWKRPYRASRLSRFRKALNDLFSQATVPIRLETETCRICGKDKLFFFLSVPSDPA
ncbi:MAG: hypothetical protein AB7E52_06710 [Bdellovibrionales bacterium]